MLLYDKLNYSEEYSSDVRGSVYFTVCQLSVTLLRKSRSKSRDGIYPLYPRLMPVFMYALEVPH